jgi:hypothetical protein
MIVMCNVDLYVSGVSVEVPVNDARPTSTTAGRTATARTTAAHVQNAKYEAGRRRTRLGSQ